MTLTGSNVVQDGTDRMRGRPKKTRWDGVKVLVCPDRMHMYGRNRKKIKGYWIDNPSLYEKLPLKQRLSVCIQQLCDLQLMTRCRQTRATSL